jgi:hypothetical protein
MLMLIDARTTPALKEARYMCMKRRRGRGEQAIVWQKARQELVKSGNAAVGETIRQPQALSSQIEMKIGGISKGCECRLEAIIRQ